MLGMRERCALAVENRQSSRWARCVQFVVRPSPGDPAQNEVVAVGFKFNAYGGIQKEDGSWWTKYGVLYATDLKDAR